jgi:tetratricopeptide (TPR) repeat protein
MLFKQEVIDKIRYEANNFYQDKDFRKALEHLLIMKDYEAVLGLRFYFRLADCYKKTGDYRRAIEVLENIVAADPRNVGALMEQGNIYRDALGEAEASLKLLNQACQIVIRDYTQTYGDAFSMLVPPASTPDMHYELFYARAQTYFILRQFTQAKSDCNWAAFLRPLRGEAPYLLGLCDWETGQSGSACEAWKTAADRGNADAVIKLQTLCQ